MNIKAMLAAIAVLAVVTGGLMVVTRRGVPGAPQVELPPGLFVAAAPDGAQNIAEVRKEAKVGDRVTVRGRVGGSKRPFVAGRAVFQVMDVNVPTCRENHNTGCPTPWDYCCAPREQRIVGAATVQVTDGAGAPVHASLEGADGLAPLTEVVVVGKVARVEGGLVIDASGIHVGAK